MAIYLAPDVIDNAFNDLNSLGGEDVETSPANIGPSTGALLQPSNRKRKHGTKTVPLEKLDTTGPDFETPNMRQMTPISVKIAVLDTLEVLLIVVCEPHLYFQKMLCHFLIMHERIKHYRTFENFYFYFYTYIYIYCMLETLSNILSVL